MYQMAKKGREALKSKARRLASEKDSKVDSSDWSPAEPLNADAKTGMRPVSRRAYKSGGKVMGEACAPRADRKPRKAGGKVAEEKSEAKEWMKAKINRDVKAANEEREGVKHIGGLKTGGRAKKANGGAPSADHPPPPPRPRPAPPAPPRAPENRVGEPGSEPVGLDKAGMKRLEEGRKYGGRSKRKDGGKVATSLAGQEKIQKEQAAASKPHRGKAEHYKAGGKAEGGYIPHSTKAGKPVIPGMKKGGYAKKADGGMLAGLAGGALPGLAASAMRKKDDEGMKKGGRAERKAGGRVGKGKTNINIVIAAGKPAGGEMPGTVTAPAGMRPPGGVPVPMPAQGAAPPPAAPMPMPVPMPMPAPGGAPMPRKRGGRVFKSYKDMTAGAGSGEGRLQKTEIQERKR